MMMLVVRAAKKIFLKKDTPGGHTVVDLHGQWPIEGLLASTQAAVEVH